LVLTELSSVAVILDFLKSHIPWLESQEEKAKVDQELLEEEREHFKKEIQKKERRKEELEEKLSEAESKKKDLELVMNALERKGIDTEALVENYQEKFRIILMYPGYQKNGKDETDKFIKEELNENYDAIELGGGLKLVPPAKVPDNIKETEDLESWVNSFYPTEEHKSIVGFATVLDLRDIFWHSDYDETKSMRRTIGDKMNVDQIFQTEEEFFQSMEANDISLLEIVEEMNIGYFAAKITNREEAEDIYDNLDSIQSELNQPSLLWLSEGENKQQIREAVEDYTNTPEELAEGIQERAQFWEEKRN
jgi:ABC-type phosphate transport system auxiliary subunit